MKQETRRGTQGLEEIDTYEMLDKLRPERRGRCRRGAKAVGRACCDPRKLVVVEFDERIGVALSRAADFVKGMPQREAEVKAAAADVLRTARMMESKQQQKK
jgi:hypothetical protein